MIEIKNYSKSVDKDEINKFKNDLISINQINSSLLRNPLLTLVLLSQGLSMNEMHNLGF